MMRRRVSLRHTTIAITGIMLFIGRGGSAGPARSPVVTIAPHLNSRIADIRILGYPRDTFVVQFPEVVNNDSQFLLGPEGGGFRESDVRWHSLGPSKWVTSYEKPGVGSYWITIEVHNDEVDMLWRVRNTSAKKWEYTSATAHFGFDDAPDFVDAALSRTYFRINGKWVALKDTDHSDGGWSTQWYLPKGFRPAKLMRTKPHPKNSFGLSSDRPDNGLVAVVSRDGRMVVGQAFERVQYICLNVPHCVHPAVDLGDIAPNEEAVGRGKFYFIAGSLDDLLARYLKDFPPGATGEYH